MHDRIGLQEFLENIAENSHVYFQPPTNVKMAYPAIRYSLSRVQNRTADNSVYTQNHRYNVIVIDKRPDSPIVMRLSKFPFCEFERSYIAENLNHFVFTLYY